MFRLAVLTQDQRFAPGSYQYFVDFRIKSPNGVSVDTSSGCVTAGNLLSDDQTVDLQRQEQDGKNARRTLPYSRSRTRRISAQGEAARYSEAPDDAQRERAEPAHRPHRRAEV